MTSPYLEASEYIDWRHPQVPAKAQGLMAARGLSKQGERIGLWPSWR
jgi:hypothetical protein